MRFIDKIKLKIQILAVPELVSGNDFNLAKLLDNATSNGDEFSKLTSKSSKMTLERIAPNVALEQVGQKIFLADYGRKHLDFFVQYELDTLRGKSTLTQIAIWADVTSGYIGRPGSPLMTGKITSHVFFDILLPKADVLATDIEQTVDGRRFWLSRCRDAIQNGLFVYCWMRDQNKMFRVATLDDLRELAPLVWSPAGQFGRYRRLLIGRQDVFADAESIQV